ncbi:hypothetical protein [Novosphingobium sp. HR1a]|nr:hypothetical protein [Novosphingobium sp. HR1a]
MKSAFVANLLGAELNCEQERQTSPDTTAEEEQPLGKLKGYAAETAAHTG